MMKNEIDLGTAYDNNLEDFSLDGSGSHALFSQAIIKSVCINTGIDYEKADTSLAFQTGVKILGELLKNNRLAVTQKEAIAPDQETEDKKLYERACELTDLADQINLVESVLANASYAVLMKDDFAWKNFIFNGELDLVSKNLESIRKRVQEVSNDILPDE